MNFLTLIKNNSIKLVIIAGLFLSIKTNGQTMLRVDAGTTLHLTGDVTLVHQGDIQNDGIINSDANSTLLLNGSILQYINGSAVNNTTFGLLNTDNASGVAINTNVDVLTSHTFSNGFVQLNNNNLTLDNGATYAGNDATSKFYITNGTGYLIQSNVGSSSFIYPVGQTTASADYSHITISNNGTADNFGVRVQSGQYDTYNSNGIGIGSPDLNDRVQKTWVVNEATAGGSDLSVNTQWQGTDEVVSFDRTNSMINSWDFSSSSWSYGAMSSATGGDPYQQTRTNMTFDFTERPISVVDYQGSALPVQLLSFTADLNSQNETFLNWTTVSELGLNRYDVLRRIPGSKEFIKIGEVAAQGYSTMNNVYSFIDKNPVNGINYYRLELVNSDNSNSYSVIKQVDVKNSSSNVSVYPNPSSTDLNLTVSTIGNATLSYSVLDEAGRIFLTEDLGTFETVFQTQINLSYLQPGIYFIRVLVGGDVSNLKFVKQ